MTREIKTVACVGGGVIGAAWAARFALNGLDVVVSDPSPNAQTIVDEVRSLADRAYARLTLAPAGKPGTVTVVTDLATAVQDADFVQESVPERLDLKRSVYAQIEEHSGSDVLIASSTSGFKPSDLQEGMRAPERLIVGHPFNPVYLLPLVELVGGEKTTSANIDAAKAFYTGLGMHPLVLRKEIDAFVADRLMEALWREALWLVNDDVATAEEIDDAIRFGCGLRWAQMGTFQVFNIAGGPAGMRHFMAQFGPALKWPWTKLMDVPEMTDELVEKISTQCEAQSDGLDTRALERIRDDNLIAIMQALKTQNWGAGATLAAYEMSLFDKAHAAGAGATAPDEGQPLRLYDDIVRADWTDYNNHMSESRYLEAFANSTDAFMRHIGADQTYIDGGQSYFTAETHIVHVAEVKALEPIYATTHVLSSDAKRMHLFHRLHHGRDNSLLATGEHMLLHVDLKSRRVAPASDTVTANLERVRSAQSALPKPEGAGRHVGQRP